MHQLGKNHTDIKSCFTSPRCEEDLMLEKETHENGHVRVNCGPGGHLFHHTILFRVFLKGPVAG